MQMAAASPGHKRILLPALAAAHHTKTAAAKSGHPAAERNMTMRRQVRFISRQKYPRGAALETLGDS